MGTLYYSYLQPGGKDLFRDSVEAEKEPENGFNSRA